LKGERDPGEKEVPVSRKKLPMSERGLETWGEKKEHTEGEEGGGTGKKVLRKKEDLLNTARTETSSLH